MAGIDFFGPGGGGDVTQAYVDAADALKANDADVVHDTGNETVAGTKSFTDPVVFPVGAVAAMSGQRTGVPGTGFCFPSTASIGLGGSGVLALTASSSSVTAAVPFTAQKTFNMAAIAIGATLNMVNAGATATPGILIPTDPNGVINLFARTSWTPTPMVYFIWDMLGILGGGTGITVNPYDDGLGIFNSINGADPVNGVWNDSGGGMGVGPGGPAAVLNTAFGKWAMWGGYMPGGDASGAVGGFVINVDGTPGY